MFDHYSRIHIKNRMLGGSFNQGSGRTNGCQLQVASSLAPACIRTEAH